MKLLITGANGQLGEELRYILNTKSSEIGVPSALPKISEIYYTGVDQLDITKKEDVEKYIQKTKPTHIINCAAYTNVDACEKCPDTAFQINSYGALNIAEAAYRQGAVLLHISTDYVFSGLREQSSPYKEWDLIAPKTIYGRSKALGESFVLKFPQHLVIRTSWLYGYVGENFVKTILKLAFQGKPLRVVGDQFGNPTNANDLAYHLLDILTNPVPGIYHCTGKGVCSWYEFANEFLTYSGLKYRLDRVSTSEFPRPAKRPDYSALDNMMLRNIQGDKMRYWKDAIAQYMTHFNIDTGEIQR